MIGIAQERLASNAGRTIAADGSVRYLRDTLVKRTLWEAATVHFLIGVLPSGWSAMASAVRNLFVRGDTLVGLLAILSVWSKIIAMMSSAHVAFSIRLVKRWQ